MNPLYESFYRQALAILGPCVQEIQYPRELPRANAIELGVKTQRVPLGGDDCDALGSEPPDEDANLMASHLGTMFGLVCEGWYPVEKGWGYFEYTIPGKRTA
jgi:hypothetical protein